MDCHGLKKASLENLKLYMDKTSIPDMENFILSNEFHHLDKDLRKAILRNRKDRLNRQFVFSKENVAQILRVNERLKEVMKSLRDETLRIKGDLDDMIQGGKTYYKDYNIESRIAISPDEEDFPLLAKLCGWATCYWCIALSEEKVSKEDDLLLEKLNWDIELLEPLKDCGARICYATHSIFVDDTVLSLQDMIQIKNEDIYYGEEIYL